MEALPLRDERRVAYFVSDRFSTQFLTTWTRADWALNGGDFEDHLAVVMGWPSPLTLPHAGKRMRDGRGGSVTLSAHGWELGTIVCRGQHHRRQHDAIESVIFQDSAQAGLEGESVTQVRFRLVDFFAGIEGLIEFGKLFQYTSHCRSYILREDWGDGSDQSATFMPL